MSSNGGHSSIKDSFNSLDHWKGDVEATELARAELMDGIAHRAGLEDDDYRIQAGKIRIKKAGLVKIFEALEDE